MTRSHLANGRSRSLPRDCDLQLCGCHAHNGFLTRKGYRALDMADQLKYLDKVSSVSGFPSTLGDTHDVTKLGSRGPSGPRPQG